jgi:hypothetical protein
MISHQCRLTLTSLRQDILLSIRSGILPPLTIFEANANQIGLLSRDEIVNIIGFSAGLADLRYLVARISQTNRVELDDRQLVITMLANSCRSAATFLRVLPVLPEGKSEDYQRYIAELESAAELR